MELPTTAGMMRCGPAELCSCQVIDCNACLFAGFDVWMTNTRGNTYSRGHLFLSQWGQRYWRFSMDELALIDLPAMIDYVLKFTKASKLAYVGHSQGCTLIYMLLSAKVQYNDKISVVVHVGPVAFIEFIRAPFLKGQTQIHSDQVSAVRGGVAGAAELVPSGCAHMRVFTCERAVHLRVGVLSVHAYCMCKGKGGEGAGGRGRRSGQ